VPWAPVTVGQHFLDVPGGLVACAHAWCRSLKISYGYDAAIGHRVTFNFTSARDRARALAAIKKQCAALRRYNPALAALGDEVW
jgi:hypothetical protein